MNCMSREKIPIPTEHDEQKALFSWLAVMEHKYPELAFVFAVPNSAKRNPKTAQYMKSEGMKAGVPDIVIPIPRGRFHGMFVEMKRRKGGKISVEQNAWLQGLYDLGYYAVICYGWDEARSEIENYLLL